MRRWKSVASAIALSLSFPALAVDAPFWLKGEASGARNDDGSLTINYSSGRTAEAFVQLAGRTPLIWARYNPGQAVGHVLVTRATRLPDGSTQVQITPYRPSQGASFATGGVGKRLIYFGGVNPFQQFDAASDEYFRGINFTAFLASTGLVMRSVGASTAFVYYPALTPGQTVAGGGDSITWNANGTANFTMEGRWLLGLQGEAGDRRGFVPAFRVFNCDPALDPRSGCVVKGFASFIPWDFGNLPSSAVALTTRVGAERPELGLMGAAFEGLEGYLRDASLWADASWTTIAGTVAGNGIYNQQSGKIGEGDLGRRDRLAEVNSGAGSGLGSTATYGMVTPGTPSLWNPNDVATSEFITRSVGTVAGGLGAAVGTADWRQLRDTAQAQDVRARQGTAAAVRTINDTTN